MRNSGSSIRAWSAAVVAVAVLSPWAPVSRARAFGGLWSSQKDGVVATGLDVLMVDDPGPTMTAVIQLRVAGPAQPLAWVIPLPSAPKVVPSSRVVFARLAAATA